MKDIKTIGIIGLGALGTMYATLLTQSLGKERVLVLADRERTERYRRDGFGLWAVVEKETGVMVGQCGLSWQSLGDGRQVPEVGYLLERAAWHKGYATEAARACRDYAFEILGFEEVYSIIRDNNLPSQAVARRNGMTVRGSFVKHYYGMDMPHLIFSVSRHERPEGKTVWSEKEES